MLKSLQKKSVSPTHMLFLSEAEKLSSNRDNNVVARNAGSDIDDNRVDFV